MSHHSAFLLGHETPALSRAATIIKTIKGESMSELGDRLYTCREAAAVLRIHPGTLYRLASKRVIISYKYAGIGIRFRPSDLERFINQGKRTKRDLPTIADCRN